MGKYSNVNSKSLLNATKSAISELSKYNVGSIRKEITSKSIFKSNANKIVDDNLDSIDKSKSINGSIAKLKEKLNNLETCAEKISKYQSVEEEIDNLEKNLYNWDGSIDMYVNNKLKDKKKEYKNLEQEIDDLLS